VSPSLWDLGKDASVPSQPSSKRQSVVDLLPNQDVNEVYLLKSCEVRTARNGSLYLQMKLTDQTGTVDCRVWDASEAMGQTLCAARFVQVKGRAETYQNRLQVVAAAVRPVNPDRVDVEAFLPRTQADIETMWSDLRTAADTIENPHMKALINAFLDDPQLAEDFKRCPAAVSYHQPYLGGLLEHTLNIIDLASYVCRKYPALNRDLLMASVILHDVGKTRELTYDGPFDYTDTGKLLGHLVIGVMMIQDRIRELPDFPDDLRDVLCHMILSHHGEYEWGSPKLPMTPEAFALHHLDNLDAKVEAASRAIENDHLAENPWTEWNPMFKRELYKGLSENDQA